jgi:hypothetical protein
MQVHLYSRVRLSHRMNEEQFSYHLKFCYFFFFFSLMFDAACIPCSKIIDI